MCKSLKFGYADKLYKHKPESVLENGDAGNSLELWDIKWSPNLGQKMGSSGNKQEGKNLLSSGICHSSGP